MTLQIKKTFRKTHILFIALLLTVLVVSNAMPQPAYAAATLTVTTTADEINTNGQCSLREAIINANNDNQSGSTDCLAGTGDDTITFSVDGTFTLDIGTTNEDAALDGDLDILDTLTITGNGAGNTIIDGNATERIFHVGAHNIDITISGVSITNGRSIGLAGGGINSQYGTSSITLNNSVVSDNVANSNGGGGIYILNGVPLTLNNSTVSGNSTAGGAGNGGGIYNSESSVTLNNSTVSGNSATSHGGGIFNEAFLFPATTNLNHSTITGNTADSDSDDSGDGGGIYNNADLSTVSTATVNFTNSIVAGNSDNSTPANNDCATVNGARTSLGYNIIGNNDGCSVTAEAGDNFGTTASPVDAKLLPLANNGGPTQTHAFDSASPAHNQIPAGTNGCGTTYTTDQRGQPRPFEVLCDIGAYEGHSAAATAPEIDVQGNGQSIANGSTTPAVANDTDFGSTGFSGGTVVHTFTISNTGDADLTLSPVALAAGTHFSVTVQSASPVISGTATTFNVTFDPTAAGPFTDTVSIANNDADENPYTFVISGTGVEGYHIFLPAIMHNYSSQPDLVVEAVTITADSLELVVRNAGGSAVVDGFWVDMYINPDIAPTGINQTWKTNGGDGLVWGVTDPLLAGESLTLTLSSTYYSPDHSQFSGTIAAGSTVYAQVDAVGPALYGAILEADENNNISGPLVTTVKSEPTAVVGITSPFLEKFIAVRP